MEFAFQVYTKDLKNISPLTAEEEKRLFKRVSQGDSEAKKSIVISHLPLVIKIASRFFYYGTSLLDLISEGNIGLIRAVEKFDCTMGQRFSKYASWWIKWTIIRALTNNSKTVHIPVYMAEKVSKWKKTSSRLANTLQRPPDRNEIAEELNVDEKQARWIERAVKNTYTLNDTNLQKEASIEFGESIPDDRVKMPEEELMESYDKKELRRLMDVIDQREAHILKMRYGLDGIEPMTLQEVSEKLNISREWVRKIEKKAISRLNQLMTCNMI
ncbi:MAG TPA: sigma-70 family RNA polymerase sigma factor [Candidatus Wunengus sp. YC63]|uniref:sigma-70 family RNA polymerase sigma factor n=1 Tax=unclassified Candidatus Wunengus TaxID=3367695 RepID=UPI0040289911